MPNHLDHISSPSQQRPKSPVECAIDRLCSNITACEARAAGLGETIQSALVDYPEAGDAQPKDEPQPATSLLVDQIDAAASRIAALSRQLQRLQNSCQL